MQRTHVREDEQRLHRERNHQPDEEPAIYPCSGVRNAVIHRSLQTRSTTGRTTRDRRPFECNTMRAPLTKDLS